MNLLQPLWDEVKSAPALEIENDLGSQVGYLTSDGILWMLPVWPSGEGNN